MGKSSGEIKKVEVTFRREIDLNVYFRHKFLVEYERLMKEENKQSKEG